MKLPAAMMIAFSVLGCGTSGTPVAQNSEANSASGPMRTERARSTIDHTTENQTPKAPASNSNSTGGKWSQSGEPIDTKPFDDAIAAAERSLKAKSSDPVAKLAAADAYFKRGFALTEARQYASALGDYRRALKILPDHEDSLKWEKQIIGIYEMMKKDYPKPGEEPPPLPFKGEKGTI